MRALTVIGVGFFIEPSPYYAVLGGDGQHGLHTIVQGVTCVVAFETPC